MLYSWHLCVLGSRAVNEFSPKCWKNCKVSAAAASGRSCCCQGKAALLTATGSCQQGSSLSPSPCLPVSLSLPHWQRLIRSQLGEQKSGFRVPGLASQSRLEKGGCGLRGSNLKASTHKLFRSVVSSQMFGEFSQYLVFLV